MSTSDPRDQSSRVFVGGVPPGSDPKALEKKFEKYGRVKAVTILKGFAFVQYGSPDEAEKAIEAENGGDFEGHRLDVKWAKRSSDIEAFNKRMGKTPGGGGGGPPQQGRGGGGHHRGGGRDHHERGPPAPPMRGYGGDRGGRFGGPGGHPGPGGPEPMGGGGGPRNDCEIVCVTRHQREYAETIEARLKNMGLKIDVLFPNPDIPLPKILGNIASRGVLFAIVITPLNEEHNSMTVNILQGQSPQEHRNMPYDDAMGLLAKSFEDGGSGGGKGGKESGSQKVGPNDDVPNDIRTCVGFFMDRRPLSVMEYDKVIKYLALRREAVLRQEYGDNIPADLAHPPVGPNNLDPATKAKQVELSDRILKILNKPNPRPQPSSASGLGGLSDLGGMGIGGGVGGGDLQSAIENLIRTGPNLLASVQASTSGSGYGAGDSSSYNYGGYD